MELSARRVRERLEKRRPRKVAVNERTRFASVAAVLRFEPEPQVLLIKRSERPSDPWSGHIAFPGGRKDEGDPDLTATAIRETREEVGIDLARQGSLLGRLDDVQAISRARPMDLVVVPYVFALAGEVAIDPDPREVDDALWAPLAPMLDGSIATVRPYEYQGVTHDLPAWRVGAYVVWGLTYHMLELLFEAIRDPSGEPLL